MCTRVWLCRGQTAAACPPSSPQTLSPAVSPSAGILLLSFEALAVIYLLISTLLLQEKVPGDPDHFDVSLPSTFVYAYIHTTQLFVSLGLALQLLHFVQILYPLSKILNFKWSVRVFRTFVVVPRTKYVLSKRLLLYQWLKQKGFPL